MVEGGDAVEEKESVILSCLVTPTTCSSSSSSNSAPAPQRGVPVKVKLPLVCITQVTHLLKRLGRCRLLYLAGLRCTTGSLAAHCPPSRYLTFNILCCKNVFDQNVMVIISLAHTMYMYIHVENFLLMLLVHRICILAPVVSIAVKVIAFSPWEPGKISPPLPCVPLCLMTRLVCVYMLYVNIL